MATFAYIVGESSVRLWSLDSRERINRQLKQIGGVNLVNDLSNVPEAAHVLLLRADYLFEVRTLRELLEHDDSAMMHANDDRPAAAFGDQLAVRPQQRERAGAHRAEPGHADPERLGHEASFLAALAGRTPCFFKKVLMPRTAWRVRCSFSTRARRT